MAKNKKNVTMTATESARHKNAGTLKPSSSSSSGTNKNSGVTLHKSTWDAFTAGKKAETDTRMQTVINNKPDYIKASGGKDYTKNNPEFTKVYKEYLGEKIRDYGGYEAYDKGMKALYGSYKKTVEGLTYGADNSASKAFLQESETLRDFNKTLINYFSIYKDGGAPDGVDVDSILNGLKEDEGLLSGGYDEIREREKYYGQWKDADEYKAWDAANKEHQRLMTLDTEKEEAAVKKLEGLRSSVARLGPGTSAWLPGDIAAQRGKEMDSLLREAGYDSVEALDAEIKRRKNDIRLSRAEKQAYAKETFENEAKSAADFDYYVRRGKALADAEKERENARRGSPLAEAMVSNGYGPGMTMTTFSDIEAQYAGGPTEEERQVFYYYNAKHEAGLISDEEFKRYTDAYLDAMDKRGAEKMYNKVLKDKPALEYLYGAHAGLSQHFEGLGAWFDKDGYVEPGQTAYTSGLVRENLKENNGGAGQVVYDLITTTANMVPSIATGYLAGAATGNQLVGRIASGLSIGASAGGQGYADMINEGYTEKQAKAYGMVTGVLETALESVLNGIGALGEGALTKLTGRAMKDAAEGIQNAALRWAVKTGARYASESFSEGLEEGLQDILSPFVKWLFTGDSDGVDWGEAAYSAFLGALTAVPFNASTGAINAEVSKQQVIGMIESGNIDALMELGDAFDKDTYTGQLLSRVDFGKEGFSKKDVRNMGKALRVSQTEADAVIRRQVERAVAAEGVKGEAAKTLTDIAVRYVNGETVTGSDREAVRGLNIGTEGKSAERVLDRVLNKVSDVRGNVANTVNAYTRAQTGQEAGYGKDFAVESVYEDVREALTGFNEKTLSGRVDTENGVHPRKIASIENGKMRLELTDGRTVDAQDVKYADPNIAMLYEGVCMMGLDAETSNYLINIALIGNARGNNENVGMAWQVRDIQRAYRAGQYGNEKAAPDVLSRTQWDAVYAKGEEVAEQNKRNKAAASDIRAREAAGEELPDATKKAADIAEERVNNYERGKERYVKKQAAEAAYLDEADRTVERRRENRRREEARRVEDIRKRAAARNAAYEDTAKNKRNKIRWDLDEQRAFLRENEADIASLEAKENLSDEGKKTLRKLRDEQTKLKNRIEILEKRQQREEARAGKRKDAVTKGTKKETGTVSEAADAGKGKTEPVPVKTATVKSGGRTVTFKYIGVDLSRIADGTQRNRVAQSMAVIRMIASKISHTDVVFYASEVKNGRRVLTVDLPGRKAGSIAPNGIYYNGTLYLDINAGQNGEGGILFAAAHELTHFMRDKASDKYDSLRDFIRQQFPEEDIDALIDQEMFNAADKGTKLSYDNAEEEVIARFMERMFTDTDAAERMAALKAHDEGLWQKIRSWFEEKLKAIRGLYEGIKPYGDEAVLFDQMRDRFDELAELFAEGVVEAGENYEATKEAAAAVGVDVDAKTDSAAPMFSLDSWNESEYVKDRKNAIIALASGLGVSKNKAGRYIDSINSIAKMIADDRTRLDYIAAEGLSSFVSNVEYGGSFDFSTLCAKRRYITGTIQAIQAAIGDGVLSPIDILKIRNMMKERKYVVNCGLCYVEGSRSNMGKFAKEFIARYKQHNPNATWIPKMQDVFTPVGIEHMRTEHPDVYEQYEKFWNNHGKIGEGDTNLFASQQKPKQYQMRTDYKNEITKLFKDPDQVKTKNRNGGIRIQSFSDFELVHAIDMMQVLMDMSRVGLAGQAYTKVPEFAWMFGNTGLKINLSLIAKGVDANGNLIFDDVEGMPHDEAFDIRDNFSKNVGTIIVTFDDAQLYAAMADPRIDFIIPFHRSQWKKAQYADLGLPSTTKDYTYVQNEKYLVPKYHEWKGKQVKTKATNYMPNTYWDFSKTGKENAEHYLEMCAADGKRPKFYKLLDAHPDGSYTLKKDGSTDGYWKLLIDFKMYDNEGVGSPQEAVRPDFNMGGSGNTELDSHSIQTLLGRYEGGHDTFPVAQDVVEEFTKEYKQSERLNEKESDIRFSERNTPVFSEHAVSAALWDVLDHKDEGHDNLILVSQLPRHVSNISGINGDLYIYRDHAYENMATREEAVAADRNGTNLKRHFHGIGIEKMKSAMLSLDHPIMTIETKGHSGNPALILILDEFGNNGAPLYAVLEFYADTPINGRQEKRPHINLTIAEREYTDKSGRAGYDEIIGTAIKDKRVLFFNKKKRDDLSVIAQAAGLGNITDFSLKNNIARFQQTVNRFRSENNINYSDREDVPDARTLLSNAMMSAATNDVERTRLEAYQEKIGAMNAEQEKLNELNRQIKELSFVKGKRDTDRLRALKEEKVKTQNRINIYDKQLIKLEASEPLRNVLRYETEKAVDRERQKARERLSNEKRAAAERLDRKVRETRDHTRQAEQKKAEERKKKQIESLIEEERQRSLKFEMDMIRAAGEEYNKLERAKKRSDRKIENLQKQLKNAKESRQMGIDQRHSTDLRNKIKRIRADFEQRLFKGNERTHIPEPLVRGVIAVCAAIDPTGENQDTKAAQKYRTGLEALSALRSAYDGLKKSNDSDLSTEFQQEFSDRIGDLADAIGNKPLRDMNRAQLEDVYNMLSDIRHMLMNAKKQIGTQNAITNYKTAKNIVNNMFDVKRLKLTTWKLSSIFRNWFTNPMRAVREMSGYDKDSELMRLFDDLMDGVRKGDMFRMTASQRLQNIITGRAGEKALRDAAQKKIDFGLEDVDGNKLLMTKMQAMQLLLTYERETSNENRMHLSANIYIPDADLIAKGKYADALKAAQKLPAISMDTINALTNGLNDWDMAFMDAARDVYRMSADAVNETSMELIGRPIATEKNYIGYEVNQDFIAKESENVEYNAAVANMGMLNSVVPNSRKPVVIRGLNTVLEKHIDDVAKYAGLAIPVRNWNKAFNTIMTVADGGTPVKEAIRDVWGNDGLKLLDQAVADLQGNRRNDTIPVLLKLKGNFVQATLASNISVWLKQGASYPTAGAVLSPAALIKGLSYLGSDITRSRREALWAEIDRHTATHYNRRIGMSTEELAEYSKSRGLMKRINGRMGHFSPMMWIQSMDVRTTAALWVAAKAQVKSDIKGTDIKVGSEEYWDKVTDLYNRVIEETQPMYDPLHRAEIMKNKAQNFIMFQTQPLQNSGILRDAAMELRAAKKRYGLRSKEAKAATGKFMQATTSQLASHALFAALTLAAAALTHRMDKYRDDDDEKLTAESVGKQYLIDFGETVFGAVVPVFGNYIISALELLTGQSKYDVLSEPVVDMINTTINRLSALKEPSFDRVIAAITDIAGYLGVPAGNARKIIQGIKLHYEDIRNGKILSFDSGVSMNTDQLTNRVYDALVSGDSAEAARLRGMYKSEDAYHKAVRTALKDNDDRIAQAVLAKLDGRMGDYHDLVDEIVADGFERDDVVKAIKSWSTVGGQLSMYGKGGGVDLLNRPQVSSDEMKRAGWYEVDPGSYATIYTSTYSDESGNRAVNVTPIVADEDGNLVKILSPEELEKYANDLLAGKKDKLGLQIGAIFDGDDAIRRADDTAEKIHVLQEKYYAADDEADETADGYGAGYKDVLAAVTAGSESDVRTVYDDLVDSGKTEKKAGETVRKAVKEAYLDGYIDRDAVEGYVKDYSDKDADEIYWTLDEWDYAKEHDGKTDGYAKYNAFIDAVGTGKNLRAEIDRYLSHGVKKEKLASEITTYYNTIYKAMSDYDRASLQGYLLNAYYELGYDPEKKKEDIKDWLDD